MMSVTKNQGTTIAHLPKNPRATKHFRICETVRLLALGAAAAVFNASGQNPPPQNAHLTGTVLDAAGKPASGLEVRTVFTSGPGVRETKTDAAGKFEVQWYPNQTSPMESIPCVVARDTERNLAVAQDLDENSASLNLKLQPALTVVGQVECEGKPLTNATATLIFWSGRSGMHLEGLARTNIPGRFEIPALPPGRKYGIMVSAPGYGQRAIYDISASADPGRQELDVIELKPANLKLAGLVVDADDQPIGGINVNLSGEGQPSAHTTTDSDGRFSFEHACEGRAQLFANAQNSYGNITAEGGDTNIVLRLGQSNNNSPGAVQHKLRGTVTGPDGKPVAGAQLAVFPLNGSVRWIKSGTNGVFNLSWSLESWQLRSGNAATLIVRDVPHNLAAIAELDEEATNLDVQLKPALTVSGRAEEPNGSPIAGAQVGMWLHAGNSYDQFDDRIPVSDAQGRFEIRGLPADASFLVYLTAKGRGRSQQQVGPGADTNRLELEPFVLRPADKIIAGKVVDTDDKPVSGASVSLSNVIAPGEGQPDGNTTTDRNGLFRLQVCEGRVLLYANAQGGNGYANANFEAGETNVVLQLRRSGSVASETPRRPSLKGRPLPDLAALGLAAETVPAGKPVLLCLADVEQRPSRRVLRLLSDQQEALKQKGITLLAAQVAATPDDTFKAWKDANPLPFAVGRVTEKSDKIKWATEVESLPWLILIEAQHRVAAEGFSIEELDAQLPAISK
jgi:hypothetical protein